jgi:anti-sigma B factor antagonist
VDSFEVTTQVIGAWTVLGVSGELDAATGPALRQAIVDQLGSQMALVIDLSAVPFLDSSGLGILVAALKRVREVDGRLKLVIASDDIRKLMRITSLDLVFDITDNLADATEPAPQVAH